jgi:phosphoserine aminotransferase
VSASPGRPSDWEPRRALEQELYRLEIALDAAPGSVELQFEVANTLQALGRNLDARAAYLELLRCDPDHLGALRNMAQLLARERLSAAARLLLERAVEKHPGDLACQVNLGTLLLLADDLPGARARYETALRIAPDDPHAHAGMSFVLARQGDERGAAAHRNRGFAGRPLIARPYRGDDAPVLVLLLVATTAANVPIERFLDDRTFQVWIAAPEFLARNEALPEHHLVVNAIGDADGAPTALDAAQAFLARTTAAVINHPLQVALTGRVVNARRLAAIAGVVAPRAVSVSRDALLAPGAHAVLADHGLDFPLLLRSPGFHTGEHFLQVAGGPDLAAAVAQLPGDELIAMAFIDTRDAQGWTRKYRVMMIDGELYPLHLAISRNWKVHYFSADMAHNARHRAEEKAFLDDMAAALGDQAMATLRRIQDVLGLDYAGVDFTLGVDGALVVFEANATMVVYHPDADERWEYRHGAVDRIEAAVRRLLLARARVRPPTQRAAAQGRTPAREAAPPSNALNFSGGPGALPAQVLHQTQAAILALPDTGLSILGMSHRSAWFEQLLEEAEATLRQLLCIPDSHGVLFMQGGSSLQFSMIPMNFAPPGAPAPAHVLSGYWSAKAIQEARCVRPVHLAWDGSATAYRRLPVAAELHVPEHTPYLHYVSNETVEGVQFRHPPVVDALALIADMSSDFLSRSIDWRQHAVVYAHAQKNLGPAGVTVCVVERRLLERVPPGLPPMLDYRTHLRHRSNYNTPPVFGIYVMNLVLRWLRDTIGGVEAVARLNAAKAAHLYGTLDSLSDVLAVHPERDFRSSMNACFRFHDDRLNGRFLEEANEAGFSGLAGHRAVGGIRASLYNAVELPSVVQLADFLAAFAARWA